MPNNTRFNVDLTGTNVNNKVIDEPHLLANRVYRSIAPTYGPYYTESLVVVDGSTNTTLVRDTHYKCLDVVGIPTAQSGKEICTIIVVIDQSINSNILITYQALGGQYERTHEAIKLLVDNLLTNNRPIYWPNIANRPSTFTPSHHLHRVGDVIGFEYLVVELERLKNAILLGDEIAHNEILSYIDANINALKVMVDNNDNLVMLMGITAATDANTSATIALQTTEAIILELQSSQSELDTAINQFNELTTTASSAEADAIALIETYS